MSLVDFTSVVYRAREGAAQAQRFCQPAQRVNRRQLCVRALAASANLYLTAALTCCWSQHTSVSPFGTTGSNGTGTLDKEVDALSVNLTTFPNVEFFRVEVDLQPLVVQAN